MTAVRSATPYNFVYKEIVSPLGLALISGAYSRFYSLSTALIAFAKEQQLLPYAQNLGGMFLIHLEEIIVTAPDGDPTLDWALDMVALLMEQYNDFVEINRKAANGDYISAVKLRDITPSHRSMLASWATGILKDTIVCLTPHRNANVIELSNNEPSLPYTFINSYVSDFRNYELVCHKAYLSDDLKTKLSSAGSVSFKHMTPADYFRVSPPPTSTAEVQNFYFSVHSAYSLDQASRKHLSTLRSSGVLHFGDLLFLNSEVERETQLSLTYLNGYVNGYIGSFVLSPERLITTFEVNNFYPACFMHSLRVSLSASPVLSKSLGFFSSELKAVRSDISGRQGVEFALGPSSDNTSFKRIKMYEIEDVDFYFFSRMGYFLSLKLDGVCGSLSFKAGNYYLTLRNGYQYILQLPSGEPFLMGHIEGSVNVEVFRNPNSGFYQIWYVGRSPRRYPSDPKNYHVYWKDYFHGWYRRVTSDKKIFPHLYFKPYAYVPPYTPDSEVHRVDLASLSSKVAGFPLGSEGLVFTDPYGAFNSFWKPFRTYDIMVRRAKVDGEFEAVVDKGLSYPVADPSYVFTAPGLYESYVHDGQFLLLHSRPDKHEVTTSIDPRPNTVLSFVDGHIDCGVIRVPFVHKTLKEYFKDYGALHRQVVGNLFSTRLKPSDYNSIYQLLRPRLLRLTMFSSRYLVGDVAQQLRQISPYDFNSIWHGFFRAGIVLTDPNMPDVEDVGGRFLAVLKFRDPP